MKVNYSLLSNSCLVLLGLLQICHSFGLLKPHPLDPLQPHEFEIVRTVVTLLHGLDTFYFVTVTPIEPAKPISDSELKLFLTHRKAKAVVIFKDTGRAKEITVNILTKLIEKETLLPKGVQPMNSQAEYDMAVDAVFKDPGFLERLEQMGVSVREVELGIWLTSKCAGHEPEFCGKRLGIVTLYFTNFKYDNSFAHPMNFEMVVDLTTKKVLAIDELPNFRNYSRVPLSGKSILPRKSSNYDPRLYSKEFFREGINPLRTGSEGGPSFKITDGYQLDWQGFRMRLGFNAREGLILHNISYKSRGQPRRSLIYRASLSEMMVNYGDPRPPFPEYKRAFDIGEYFSTALINSLAAGIDCEHQSQLIDVFVNDGAGKPVKTPNAICISEADGGILHKHTTDRVSVARAQNLVIKFIITVGNYDYLLQYVFHQDASIDFKVGATGLLSTNLLLGKGAPWGTMVFKHVMAQYHQHLFCLRLDTDFDGETNSISTRDILPMAENSDLNLYGNGFTTKETLLRTSLNSVTDSSSKKQRVWKIFNPERINPIAGKPRGYKLMTNNQPLLLARENSNLGKRAAFAKHSTWVLPYNGDELYAAGDYPNQNDDPDGVAKWVKRNESIVSKDIVIFHTFGFTHIPSTDEFPIMKVESTHISLKPCNFFDRYEGLNVPPPDFTD